MKRSSFFAIRLSVSSKTFSDVPLGKLCFHMFSRLLGKSCLRSFLWSLLSYRQLLEVLDERSLHEFPVNADVSQSFILGPTLFLLYIKDCPDVVFNIAINAGATTLY